MTAELQAFSDSLLAAQPSTIAPELLPRIAACLASPDIDARGASFAARIALAQRLKAMPFVTLDAVNRLAPAFRDLLIITLVHEPLLDEALEDMITRLRKSILMDVMAGARPDTAGLELIAALAIFCFGAEYVFDESDSETQALPALAQRATPATAALLACYRPLALYPDLAPLWKDAGGVFAALVAVQVTEPAAERALAAEIPSLSPVADPVSISVRAVYEENPYPRWRKLRPEAAVARQGDPRRILIAGCGTGRHALLWARLYPEAQILAVDLSRASLAYAMRQQRALGLASVDFRHGDILALAGSAQRFDLISCIGVIHHMARPQDGLNALAGLLAPDGAMELGLYTESGRPEVAAAEQLRRDHAIPATPEGIRHLRRIIRHLPEDHPARAARDGLDFYSLSGCRDYLFHVQEHRFRLPAVADMIAAAGLRLTDIGLKHGDRADFKRRFGNESDLKAWHAYEEAHPGCFGSMYEMRLARA